MLFLNSRCDFNFFVNTPGTVPVTGSIRFCSYCLHTIATSLLWADSITCFLKYRFSCSCLEQGSHTTHFLRFRKVQAMFCSAAVAVQDDRYDASSIITASARRRFSCVHFFLATWWKVSLADFLFFATAIWWNWCVYYLEVDSRESAKNLKKGKDVGFTREEFWPKLNTFSSSALPHYR